MADTKEKYKDIINLPHHVSAKHHPMPLENRAAQFAPFAALTGFEEIIKAAAESYEFDDGTTFVDYNELTEVD